jgi:hypothetical protein
MWRAKHIRLPKQKRIRFRGRKLTCAGHSWFFLTVAGHDLVSPKIFKDNRYGHVVFFSWARIFFLEHTACHSYNQYRKYNLRHTQYIQLERPRTEASWRNCIQSPMEKKITMKPFRIFVETTILWSWSGKTATAGRRPGNRSPTTSSPNSDCAPSHISSVNQAYREHRDGSDWSTSAGKIQGAKRISAVPISVEGERVEEERQSCSPSSANPSLETAYSKPRHHHHNLATHSSFATTAAQMNQAAPPNTSTKTGII